MKSNKKQQQKNEQPKVSVHKTETVFVRDYWKSQGRLIPATITTVDKQMTIKY